MFRNSLIILVLTLVNWLNCETINRNWINSCQVATCQIAVAQCAGKCIGYDECKACLRNRDDICSTCADNIFDRTSMLTINGVDYLYCDQPDFFQNNVCKMFCYSKNKKEGECKKIQLASSGCVCYDFFYGSFVRSISSNDYLKSVASSEIWNEFAVGTSNGVVNIYDNFGNNKNEFLTSLLKINNMIYLKNGNLLVAGVNGVSLYAYYQSYYYETKLNNGNGLAVAELNNRDIAYSVGKTVYIQNPSSSTSRLQLNGHTSNVGALLGHSNGDLISGSDDKTIKVWNILNGSLKRTLLGHNGIILSLVFLENGDIASASSDQTIKIWNPNFTFAIRTIDTRDNILSLTLLPNGRLAVSTSDYPFSIKIWDKDNGIFEKILTNGHTNRVNGLSVNSNRYLISVSDDYTIRLWQ